MKIGTNSFNRRKTRRLCVLLLVALLLLSLSCTNQPPSTNNSNSSPRAGTPTTGTPIPQNGTLDLSAIEKMVNDPEASRKASDDDRGAYAWDIFAYFNSPLTGNGQKVWESLFRETSTIYLPNGCQPPAWGQAQPPADVMTQVKNLPGWVAPAQVFHNLDTSIQVDGLTLSDNWNQDVRYQLLMNQPAFDYVIQRGFYNVDGQQLAAQNNQPASFPPTSFELKTSWIWVGTDQSKFDQLKATYYIAPAYYEVVKNGQHIGWEVGYAALSGMHIINRSRPNWVWITFENVNNPKFTKVKLELPIPDYAKQANQTYQQALRNMGSIFANYQLDGVQMDFQDPTLL